MFVSQGKPISYIEKITFTWVRAASFRLPKLATGSASILRGLNDFLSSPSLSATTSHTAAAPVPPFRKFAVNWTTKINEEKLIKGYKGLLQDLSLLYLNRGKLLLGHISVLHLIISSGGHAAPPFIAAWRTFFDLVLLAPPHVTGHIVHVDHSSVMQSTIVGKLH